MVFQVIAIISGTCLGLAIVKLYMVLLSNKHELQVVKGGNTRKNFKTISVKRVVISCISAAIFLMATKWVVAMAIAFVATYWAVGLSGPRGQRRQISKLEALATWTEMLRDSLAASNGLNQAILTTASISPMGIRPVVINLSTEIHQGIPLDQALLRFANEICDPVGDTICLTLTAAFQGRATKLGDLLDTLAQSTREEVAAQLQIEASRASVKSSVNTITVFSISFAVLLSLMAKSYLQPYNSFGGQAVLFVVASFYMGGILLLFNMAKPLPRMRLIESGSE